VRAGGTAADGSISESHPSSAGERHYASRQSLTCALIRFELDFEALFHAAAETGTAMEIDGRPAISTWTAPSHAVPRRRGVTIAIDSDCHRAEWLARQMRFGVGTARRRVDRTQARAQHRSIEEVRAFVARKRSRG
jgi:DNA polymerase (family 10)